MTIRNDNGQDLERLLLNSRDKFRALVDGFDDEIFSIDDNFRIIAVNRSMAEGLGLHPRDVVGRHCFSGIFGLNEPCPSAGRPCPALTARSIRRLDVVHHELPAGEKGVQQPRYLEVRAMPVLKDNGQPEEIILIRRDVTLQVEAEIQAREYSEKLERDVRARTAELSEVNRTLTRQRNELAAANEELIKLQTLKEDLINMVVHDLKGPLSEIQANLEMMRSQPVNDLQAELLEAAKLGGLDLQRMIMNLLDISRLEENSLILDRSSFDLKALISEIRDRYAPLARLNNVEIAASAADDLPPMSADRHLLERVLNNLVSNAVDHTPENGFIHLSAGLEDGVFRVEVTDSGRGIPAELHEKIFEKFSQGRGGAKTSSGLGLTFCRMAVQAHGGTIGVESRIGQGSRFLFTIPQTEGPATEHGHHA